MKAIQLAGRTLGFCLFALSLAHASDFTGVYARIDKVVLEPSGDSADRVQVWGVFSLFDPVDRNSYVKPARGYLYFKLDKNPQAARNEWNDLKRVAGTGEVVAFGVRNPSARPKLRKADQKAEDPDPYLMNAGIVRVRDRTDYEPVRAVLDFKD